MKLLLDTHILIWALSAPEKLPRATRNAILSPDNDVLFSAASIWEIAIKSQLHRVGFDGDAASIADALLEAGFVELPVYATAAARVANLPLHHRDPFDRVLIAQATEEPARLLTADGFLARYSDLVAVVER